MFSARIILDRARYYLSMHVKPTYEVKHGLPLACHTLCSFNLDRPHLTCLWCRVRRVYYKKMPSKFEVDVIIVQVNRNQKYRKLKGAIRKLLFTLAGWTFN